MGKVVSKAIGEFLHVAKVRRSHQEREWDSTWPTIFKASGQLKKIAIPVVRYNKSALPAHPPVPQAQDARVPDKKSEKESAKQLDDDEESENEHEKEEQRGKDDDDENESVREDEDTSKDGDPTPGKMEAVKQSIMNEMRETVRVSGDGN